MGRRSVSLVSKSQRLYFVSILLVLLCCAPLFFFVMKYFYTQEVDTLIRFRTNDFITRFLPSVTSEKIREINRYNDDLQILVYDGSFPLDKIIQQSYIDKEGHTVDYRIMYHKIQIDGADYILLSRVGMIENKDMLYTLASQYGLLFIILVISLVIIQRFIFHKMWNPFYDSLSRIEGFTLETGTIPPVKESGIREFDRLNEKVTDLMENNLKSYKQQKEFIENASHELQTPLAIFHTKLDILLQEPGLTESQIEIIESLYDVTSRLTGLTKNLLLLAKIDNNQFKDIEEIDFVGLLEAYVSYLESIADSNSIKLNLDIQNAVILKANKILLGSLVNNLIINGIRHNIDGGFVEAIVKDMTFTVINSGEKIPLNKDNLFKRFSRKDERKTGSGLGLCIAYQICKFHGWNIEYYYKDDLHHFKVSF